MDIDEAHFFRGIPDLLLWCLGKVASSTVIYSVCAGSDTLMDLCHLNRQYEGLSAELPPRPGLPHGGAGIMRSGTEGH